MAADFLCTNCGKLIHSAGATGKVRCTYCGRKVMIPPAMASFPRPHVPGARARAPDGPGETQDAFMESRQVELAMARTMPWVISLFLHVGLAMILMLVAIIVVVHTPVREVTLTGPLDPHGEQVRMEQRGTAEDTTPLSQRIPTDDNYLWDRKGAVSRDDGRTDEPIMVIGRAWGGGPAVGLARFGPGGRGPRVGLYDPPGPGELAHHVVYLIDKSGSMAVEGMFDNVRTEMLRSIGKLGETQTFHIILFSDGPPDEYGPRRLVPANYAYKANAGKYLVDVRPQSISGSTDPVQSLRRAFEVLRQADKRRPGRLILFLTDGVFQDNSEVLKVTRRLNADKEISINTYLYGFRPPEAVKLMKTIALESGGRYKYVSRDE